MKSPTIAQLKQKIEILELKKRIVELELEIKKIEATKITPVFQLPFTPVPYTPTTPHQFPFNPPFLCYSNRPTGGSIGVSGTCVSIFKSLI